MPRIGLWALLLLATTVRASPETLATFDACWETVRDRFYDRELHGVDWTAQRERFRPRADDAAPGRPLHGVLREMLATLRASHLTILERPAYDAMMAELSGRRHVAFGLQVEEAQPGRLFVRALYEGGPAAAMGVRLGDRLLAVDGADAAGNARLVDAGGDPALGEAPLFTLGAAAGRVRIEVQSTLDPVTRRTITFDPTETSGLDAARRSVRVVDRGGRRIGYFHVWFCQAGVAEALHEALAGPLASCDALVLDLRGRGGWSHVARRIIDTFRGTAKRPAAWSRPVVFLIDRRTRSAKEYIAYEVRRFELGPLVGQRTAGAVLGAGFVEMPDGSYLEIPVSAFRVGGRSLEGVGVAPDHEVEAELAWANGRDAILERGVEVAAVRLAE